MRFKNEIFRVIFMQCVSAMITSEAHRVWLKRTPWSGAVSERDKMSQKVSLRYFVAPICIFKMSPSLKHSDVGCLRKVDFSISTYYRYCIQKRHLAFFAPNFSRQKVEKSKPTSECFKLGLILKIHMGATKYRRRTFWDILSR